MELNLHCADSAELVCPECDSAYGLHHQQITAVFRQREDGDGTATTVALARTTLNAAKASDLPGRRDCIEIEFSCENCGELATVLRIEQHKGMTRLCWVPVGKRLSRLTGGGSNG